MENYEHQHFLTKNITILKIVEEKLKDKYTFKYSTVDPNAVFVGLQEDKYNMAVGNYYTSAERNKNHYHSNNVSFLSDLRLIVRKDDTEIKSLDDITSLSFIMKPIRINLSKSLVPALKTQLMS